MMEWVDLYGAEAYFDNSATTKPRPEVVAAVLPLLNEEYGNPSSLHAKGAAAERSLRMCREKVAESIGVLPDEIIFTSSGTEASNLAIFGTARARVRSGRHIITSQTEHAATLEACKRLEAEGFDVTYVGVDEKGQIDLDQVAAELRPDTILITLAHVNNEVGNLLDVQRLVAMLPRNEFGLPFLHLDAVQSLGRALPRPLPVRVDGLSISGHKLHGLKGCGALFVRQGSLLEPFIAGGGQEQGLRSGTENMTGIVSLATAASLARVEQEAARERCFNLRQQFLNGLHDRELSFVLNGPESENEVAPHIVNLSFPGLKAETLLHALAERNVFVSTGSACSSKRQTQSHVLRAMKLSAERMDSAIRVSFSPFNQEKHVTQALDALAESVPRLQRLAGLQQRRGRRKAER